MEVEVLTALSPLVSNVGFPILITGWFMFRTEKVISNNTKVLEEVLKKL